MEKYLTKKEVCEILRISMSTLNRMIKNKEIKYKVIRQGKRKKTIRFKKEYIENLNKQKNE